MKIRNIFESSFAIELAKDLAEQQQTLSPHQIIKKLVRFGAIGAAAFVIVVAAIIAIRSPLGEDANTRQVLLFASLMSALVFFSSIGATLVTLWDGFVGQYIQRLALAEAEHEGERVFDIPVVSVPQPEPAVAARIAPAATTVHVTVENDEYVFDGDMAMSLVARQLSDLRNVFSEEDWKAYQFDEHYEFFNNLGRNVTVESHLSQAGKSLLATAIPLMATRNMIGVYELTQPLSYMLKGISEKIEEEEAQLEPDEHAAAG